MCVQKFSGCSCDGGPSAGESVDCVSDCAMYGVYWLILFLALISHSMTRVGVIMIFIRYTNELTDDRVTVVKHQPTVIIKCVIATHSVCELLWGLNPQFLAVPQTVVPVLPQGSVSIPRRHAPYVLCASS